MSQPPQSPSPLTARLYDLEYPRSLGVYSTYQEVQAVVDTLADKHFPVQSTLIVGTDLKLMERVTGRKTWGRIIGQGIVSGLWMGLFLGLLLMLITPSNVMVVLTSVLMGIVFFTVWSAVSHLLTGGKRDFTSMTATIPMQYELLVEHKHAEQARHLLVESGAVPMTTPPPAVPTPGYGGAGSHTGGSGGQQYGQAPGRQQFGQGSGQQFGQAPGQQPYGQSPGQQQFGQTPGQHSYGQSPGQQQFGQTPGQHSYGQSPGQQQFGQTPGQQSYGQDSSARPGSVAGPAGASAPTSSSSRPTYGQPSSPSPSHPAEDRFGRGSRPSFGQPAGTPLREDERPADTGAEQGSPSAPEPTRPQNGSSAEDDPYRGSR
ncbi:general stress protein [Brachybacterium sacelli]|uniref:General stress protein 17M-like domain-containing protein n=1 Tax=Brachybacterium sacelli TaxID=173364 RepID=A0ABS4X4L9_9MICO|nr:general stress protein [Brachybacterium sacelli]MBP2383183.1 hypothetical protein [Brachybacterium sacelli]